MKAAGLWVPSGPGLPHGARVLGDMVLGPAGDGRQWLDVCLLGQHLPQIHADSEVRDLHPGGCARLGLCEDCLGFGDLTPPAVREAMLTRHGPGYAARHLDEVTSPCPGCGGTGRPALRVTITRDASGMTGSIRPLPHAYIPPLPDADLELLALFQAPADMCLACGMPAERPGRGGRHSTSERHDPPRRAEQAGQVADAPAGRAGRRVHVA